MIAGNWIPEMVTISGGIDIFGKPGNNSHWIKFNKIKEQDPDIVIFLPCGFDIKKTEKVYSKIGCAAGEKMLGCFFLQKKGGCLRTVEYPAQAGSGFDTGPLSGMASAWGFGYWVSTPEVYHGWPWMVPPFSNYYTYCKITVPVHAHKKTIHTSSIYTVFSHIYNQ